jgi:predicted aspartyl protease
MSTFTISLTLTHPDRRELSVPLDLSVDTEAAYVLLSASVVADAGIPAVDEWAMNPADEDRLVYRIGEVRMRFAGREIRTIFVAGPAEDPPSIAAFTIDTSAHANAGHHQRSPAITRL